MGGLIACLLALQISLRILIPHYITYMATLEEPVDPVQSLFPSPGLPIELKTPPSNLEILEKSLQSF